jgi:hypothetical protein
MEKIQNKEINDLHSSNFVMVTKERGLGEAPHIWRDEKYTILVAKFKGQGPFEDTKLELKEAGYWSVHWVQVMLDRGQ